MVYRGTGTKTGKYGHIQYGFTHDGIRHYQLFFRCGINLECTPPMVKGQRDMAWTTRPVDVDDAASVSAAAGVPVEIYKGES